MVLFQFYIKGDVMPGCCGLRRVCLAGFVVCLLLSPWSVYAAGGWRQGELLAGEDGKYSIWQEGFFRIRFMREGKAAVPAADVNRNGCPDFVEDVAAQLVAAHGIFCETGGIPSPLDSPRYVGLRYVDVDIRSRAAMRGNNGLAYDEIVLRPDTALAHAPDGILQKAPVLIIALSRDIDPKMNATPAHEYFHQIQNGMTHFKNPWFYEGMARWSERVIGLFRQDARTSLPDGWILNRLTGDAAYRERLFAVSYRASDMLWEHLAILCSGLKPVFADDHPLLALTYSDGNPVLRKTDFSGILMMRRVLEKLGKAERIPFARFSYEKWTEARQREAGNNPYIADAIAGAAAELCPR